ncbi:hypothetical protein RMCBS344292_01908 [Rhizopus microsporus]|nr:hypothetical protein RMCBS344292_01908 [Rhizopus microsporus]
MTLGMDLIKVPGATGDYSTDFNAKGQACIQYITSDKYDFGFCHLKAVDDAGHDKDVQKKIYYFERIDEMIGTVVQTLEQRKDESYTVIVTGDHTTPVLYGDHSCEPVPFCITNLPFHQKGDDIKQFDEVSVSQGSLGRFCGDQSRKGSPVRCRGRPRVEPSQTIPAAYIPQLSRLRPLDLGCMNRECSHCHALHWINERQETSSLSNPSWESCCKRGSIQPDPLQYLKDLLASTDTQGRHFKDNLRQYNAAFTFTSLGCDIVSAEEHNANNNNNSNSNNNRGGLNAFQIHSALCHRQGPLTPVEGKTPLYAQLYVYDPSYDAQRLPERNENLDNKIIENPSTLLSQCNPFARIYRHAYEILTNHENSSINSEDRATSNGSTESGSLYKSIDENVFN